MTAALQQQLYLNKTWQALLHVRSGKPSINDPKFILSLGQFSAKSEMVATLNAFKLAPDKTYCRFPARILFLSHYLPIDIEALDAAENCTEFKKYQRFVPFDNLNLVFASEVLSSASSMMGHTFLNAEGLNFKSNHVSHSISFFTEFSSFNPVKLIYDGLIGGMKGFFIVRPYLVDLKRYNDEEGRNVWSYQLTLDEYNKRLIKFHIWELKNLEIEYLFQSYNCATLTLYLLSIAEPELLTYERLYVSPMDVIKAANNVGMIENRKVNLATDWELNMLRQGMGVQLSTRFDQLFFMEKPVDLHELSKKERLLAGSYLKALKRQSNQRKEHKSVNSNFIDQIIAMLDDKEFSIDLTEFKDPLKSRQDSIISTEYIYENGESTLQLGFLPASHKLYGDNRQYFSESELKIAEIKLSANMENSNLSLESLTLYSVKSYIPTGEYAQQLSGEFYLGYHHVLDNKLEKTGVFELSGALGKTFRLHPDVVVYGMLGFGAVGNRKNSFFYAASKIGASISLVSDFKAIIDYRIATGYFNASSLKQTVGGTLSWFGFENITINASLQSTFTESLRVNTVKLGVDYHF